MNDCLIQAQARKSGSNCYSPTQSLCSQFISIHFLLERGTLQENPFRNIYPLSSCSKQLTTSYSTQYFIASWISMYKDPLSSIVCESRCISGCHLAPTLAGYLALATYLPIFCVTRSYLSNMHDRVFHMNSLLPFFLDHLLSFHVLMRMPPFTLHIILTSKDTVGFQPRSLYALSAHPWRYSW